MQRNVEFIVCCLFVVVVLPLSLYAIHSFEKTNQKEAEVLDSFLNQPYQIEKRTYLEEYDGKKGSFERLIVSTGSSEKIIDKITVFVLNEDKEIVSHQVIPTVGDYQGWTMSNSDD